MLEGQPNFRDIGGYATVDGRRVRTGCVYRSGHLAETTDADRRLLADLGIRTVCDLRTRREAAARPGPFAPETGVEVLLLSGDVTGPRTPTGDPVQTILQYSIREVTEEGMARAYEAMIDTHAAAFGRVVEVCADPARHAVVVHCSAGKDRTGMAVALLLSALGVPEDVVVEDYERTNDLWSPWQIERARPRLEAAGIAMEPLLPYFHAPGWVLRRALHKVRREYGSVDAYLIGRGGVSPATLAALTRVCTSVGA